jgi:hypothetical protein
MSDDRKKPLWTWIVALVIGLPVLYVASFGPACWWLSSKCSTPPFSDAQEASVLYLPIGWIYDCSVEGSPEGSWLTTAIGWYATLFISGEDGVLVPSGPAGKSVFVFNPSRSGE